MEQLFQSGATLNAGWRAAWMAFQTFIFIVDMVSDLAVAIQLFKRAVWAGAVCLSLILLPIIAYGVHETVKLVSSKEKTTWQSVVGRILDVLFCPMFAFIRYLEKLFWLVEQSISRRQEQKELAEQRANQPRRIEWYMGWRALFQAAPQSLLQMMQLILIADVNLRALQVVCGFTSIISVTIFASKFTRFESQDSNIAPWQHQKLISNKHSKCQRKPIYKAQSEEEQKTLRGDQPDSTKLAPLTIGLERNKDSGIEPDMPETPSPPPLPPRASTLSAPSRPPSRVIHTNDMDSILSEDDFKKMPFLRFSYVERSERLTLQADVSNRRSSYHYLQAIESDSSKRTSSVSQPHLSPPEFHAPAPPDFPAPAPPDKLSTVARSTVQLPTRKKGRKYLESDSTVGLCILHVHWFLFSISRVIAIGGLLTVVAEQLFAALMAAGLTVAHIVVMSVVLTVNSDRSTTKIWRSVVLAIASFYCLLEYGVKFEKISRIMLIYWPICFVENFAAGFIVYRPDLTMEMESWWFTYLFYTMIVTYGLAVACLAFYKVVLSPKRYVIYYE
ncbi:uncharacterized protein LOC135944655 [Cloeon dipterum]|uniref:uncharacterized protein LOC135944655 n=1 Tax=Cloeon dipterum TaxID=197152 RepID=UPI0032208F4C